MTLRIPFLVVLRVHLIVMAVQSGGLFEVDDRALPTPPVAWFSEAISITDPASNNREEALVADVSAASDTHHVL